MTVEMRLRADEERALSWLKRRLDWEELLAALRHAGSGIPAERTKLAQEPAAA